MDWCKVGTEAEGRATVKGWIATAQRVRLTALSMGGAGDTEFTNQKQTQSLPLSHTYHSATKW